LAGHWENVALETLRRRGVPAELTCGGTTATLAVLGKDYGLLVTPNGQELKTLEQLLATYSGQAFTLNLPEAPLWVDNPIHIVPITALGEDAVVTTDFILANRGKKPLDLTVVSTSCGCTSAQLETSHLQPGQRTRLRATMHADVERLVRVNIRTSDPRYPAIAVALQSRKNHPDFPAPAPLELFGEKGTVIAAQSAVELPAGWTISRVRTSPRWLEATLTSPSTEGQSHGLVVKTPAGAPAGYLQGSVVMELKHAPVRSLSIPIRGFITNDVTISPSIVALGPIPHGIARRIVVVHGPDPFSINSFDTDTPGLRANAAAGVVARAHAVELLIPIEGETDTAFHHQLKLGLSDGRQLSLDILGTVAPGTLPALAAGITLGKPAPAWQATDVWGHKLTPDDLTGKNILLTFFPHCFTGGCESHLSSLRDTAGALARTGTEIIAVSTDDVESVRQFGKQLRLPFPMVSDGDRSLSLAFGAAQDNREAPSRLTILIDRQGIVRYIDTDVHVQTHGADMLTKIRELGLDHP
jgi:peroxiredoxin Q/BCP